MISRKILESRGRDNPYHLTQAQLDDLEITKAQVAKHLKTIDFSKYDSQTTNPEAEKQASRVLAFSSILKDRRWGNKH